VLCHAGAAAFTPEVALEVSPEAEAEIVALDEGLWRLRNPKVGWGHASYLLETAGGPVLLDCPTVLTPALVEFLRARGGVVRIIYTHHHFLGAGQRVRQLFGAETVLHRADAHPQIVTLTVDSWVSEEEAALDGRGGEPIRALLVGGHTPGSLFLGYGTRLFTGDAFSGWNGPLGWYYTDVEAIGRARRRLEGMEIRAIYSACGHATRGAARLILGRAPGSRR
jgi:glyoxylase-like metal-dependent hydrolase (beta-lactamase superfamily II)